MKWYYNLEIIMSTTFSGKKIKAILVNASTQLSILSL